MKITKRQLRRIIREESYKLREDHISAELDHLRKNIKDDEGHIDNLEKDIRDEREEEERAKEAKKRKDESRKIRAIIRDVLSEDKSGKGKCPDSGCIKKSGDDWRIISNKTGKLWPQKYKTRKSAEAALDAYHASK